MHQAKKEISTAKHRQAPGADSEFSRRDFLHLLMGILVLLEFNQEAL